MKKLAFGLLLVLLLTGCNSELTYSEVSIKNANKNIRDFIRSVENENGIHLYFDGKKEVYVFLNEYTVLQGEKAVHFTDFDVEEDNDTLNVLFNQNYTDDYSSKELKYRVLYKIEKNKDYDKIVAYSNGEKIPFNIVSGSGR